MKNKIIPVRREFTTPMEDSLLRNPLQQQHVHSVLHMGIYHMWMTWGSYIPYLITKIRCSDMSCNDMTYCVR